MSIAFVVSRVLAYVAATSIFVLSLCAAIYSTLWTIQEGSVLDDDEGTGYFIYVWEFAIIFCVLLYLELIFSIVVLRGLYTKQEHLLLPWLWYHGGLTLTFPLSLAVEDGTSDAILYYLVNTVGLGLPWAAVLWHWWLMHPRGYVTLPPSPESPLFLNPRRYTL